MQEVTLHGVLQIIASVSLAGSGIVRSLLDRAPHRVTPSCIDLTQPTSMRFVGSQASTARLR
jgi:hypothetical protein